MPPMTDQGNNQDNQVAQAVIPVRADLDEFKRETDAALEQLEDKFAAAAEAAAKGFADKVGAALDDIASQLDAIIEKVRGVELPGVRAGEQEREPDRREEKAPQNATEPLAQNDMSEVVRKLEDLTYAVTSVDQNVSLIASRIGNQ